MEPSWTTLLSLNTSPEDKGIKTHEAGEGYFWLSRLNTSPEDKGIKTVDFPVHFDAVVPEHQP